jgi:hypothetical protein
MTGSGTGDTEQNGDVPRRFVEQRTDPRLELIVFVTPGVEPRVRQRLQAVAAELIELTGDVVVIQRHELATVVDLDASRRGEPS